MRRLGQFVGALLAIIVLGGVPYAAYLLLKAGAAAVYSLDSGSTAAVVTAAVAGFISVVTVVLSKRYEANQAALAEIRAKKVPVYERLLNFMFRVIMGGKTGKVVPPEEMEAFFADFTQQFMIWASTDVLKAWGKFRVFSASEGDATEAMFLIEDVVREIRKDLGHRDRGLGRGDVLSLFINDIHKFLKK
jgi:hypothetical protein